MDVFSLVSSHLLHRSNSDFYLNEIRQELEGGRNRTSQFQELTRSMPTNLLIHYQTKKAFVTCNSFESFRIYNEISRSSEC